MSLYIRFNKICRSIRFFPIRIKLKNVISPSVICNNCNGALILHDYKIPFNSPFVNLWIPPHDYLYLLENLKDLIFEDIVEIHQSKYNYPVGILGDKVHIYFKHYNSFYEAIKCWNRRLKRMDFNNLSIIFVERDGTTLEMIKYFDAMNYTKKIVLTHNYIPEVKSSFQIKGCEDNNQLGMIMNWSGRL